MQVQWNNLTTFASKLLARMNIAPHDVLLASIQATATANSRALGAEILADALMQELRKQYRRELPLTPTFSVKAKFRQASYGTELRVQSQGYAFILSDDDIARLRQPSGVYRKMFIEQFRAEWSDFAVCELNELLAAKLKVEVH